MGTSRQNSRANQLPFNLLQCAWKPPRHARPGGKEHSHAIVAFIGKKVTVLLRFPYGRSGAEPGTRDHRAITRIMLQTFTTAMLQIDKGTERGIVDHLMRAHPFRCANTARIMLELRTIQPALRRHRVTF